jgi:hypothetical protein
MQFSTEVANLAKLLRAKPSDDLLMGIKIEQDRIGKSPYLVVVNQNEFDIDGMSDFLYLMDSFNSQDEAEQYAEQLSRDILEKQLAEDNYGTPWALESTGQAPYLAQPKVKTISKQRVLFDRSFKTVSGEFDRRYTIVRVIGPFEGNVVNPDLADLLNANDELRYYFYRVAEAIDKPDRKQSPYK